MNRTGNVTISRNSVNVKQNFGVSTLIFYKQL